MQYLSLILTILLLSYIVTQPLQKNRIQPGRLHTDDQQ